MSSDADCNCQGACNCRTIRRAPKGTFRVYLRNPIKHEMLMALEVKKSEAKNVDLLKAFISRTLNMNLRGWELYVDMQPVTFSISSYTFHCITRELSL